MAEEKKTQMQYVRLGNSGLKVSKIILGCMSYGDPKWQGWVLDEEESIKHIRFAYEQGINTFDTANVYSNGQSEVVLGKALKEIGAPRESYVVLTKAYNPVDDGPRGRPDVLKTGRGYVNESGLSRKAIFDSVQASLKRLQLDYIDVFQCHRFDYETPIAETMQALHDIVQKGWVRYIGMSSCWAYQFHAMQNYAINNKLTPFISMQNFHNAAYREEEREMLPTLKLFGVGAIPWSPLCRGFLTRPWQAEETLRVKTDPQYKGRGHDRPDKSRQTINERVEEIAKKRGVSMAQVGLAWSLGHPDITAPIVGTTKLDNLTELIGALDVELTPEEREYINEAYGPAAITGHV
ncbi:NADP-dependent oxidoreductase domain-containing protein [Papiliotrema laurentii]|uniref:NADP-dependent oxidoreductase domain-containing protein n=1 Tax=Papiliotrema laurentii TaxID=5418 RepID=A0AAD9FR18_PAPLA|nr:NADP-dependent oxidoreductase domain-containing protein [Papiliotrema laurentii]